MNAILDSGKKFGALRDGTVQKLKRVQNLEQIIRWTTKKAWDKEGNTKGESITESCKIFEPFGFRIQQLGSTPFKVHFDAKTSRSTLDGSTPLISVSGILDTDRLSFCTIYTCQLDEIHYLETWSRCVNTSFIITVQLTSCLTSLD